MFFALNYISKFNTIKFIGLFILIYFIVYPMISLVGYSLINQFIYDLYDYNNLDMYQIMILSGILIDVLIYIISKLKIF